MNEEPSIERVVELYAEAQSVYSKPRPCRTSARGACNAASQMLDRLQRGNNTEAERIRAARARFKQAIAAQRAADRYMTELEEVQIILAFWVAYVKEQ